MEITREMANEFFLTDLVRTPTYQRISIALAEKYPRDHEGEFPDQYWDELNRATNTLLITALALNLPSTLAIIDSDQKGEDDNDE